MQRIKIIAIIGEAGSGKDTIAAELVYQRPDLFHSIVSCTTRPAREKESEGIDYFFFTEEKFFDMVNRGEILEHTRFNNWFYGTPISSLDAKKINVGVFNPSGVRSLLIRDDIDLYICRVRAADKTRLLRQLQREKNPDVEEIIRRFSADKEDFKILQFMPDKEFNNETIEDIFLIVEAIISIATSLDKFS